MLITLTAASGSGTLCAILRETLGKRSSRLLPVRQDIQDAEAGACCGSIELAALCVAPVPEHNMGPISNRLGAMLQGARADEDKTSCTGQALAIHAQNHCFAIQTTYTRIPVKPRRT